MYLAPTRKAALAPRRPAQLLTKRSARQQQGQ